MGVGAGGAPGFSSPAPRPTHGPQPGGSGVAPASARRPVAALPAAGLHLARRGRDEELAATLRPRSTAAAARMSEARELTRETMYALCTARRRAPSRRAAPSSSRGWAPHVRRDRAQVELELRGYRASSARRVPERAGCRPARPSAAGGRTAHPWRRRRGRGRWRARVARGRRRARRANRTSPRPPGRHRRGSPTAPALATVSGPRRSATRRRRRRIRRRGSAPGRLEVAAQQ